MNIPIIGDLLNKLFGVVDKVVPDRDLALKLKNELAQLDYSIIKSEIEESAKVLVAEAQGGSWLQRNWRPVLMLIFTYIIAHNYIIAPILKMIWPSFIVLEVPPDLWQLLKIGIGGYIVGRSGEKIVNILKSSNKWG